MAMMGGALAASDRRICMKMQVECGGTKEYKNLHHATKPSRVILYYADLTLQTWVSIFCLHKWDWTQPLLAVGRHIFMNLLEDL